MGTCGGRVCREYAECINYQCMCRVGYYGNGYKECESMQLQFLTTSYKSFPGPSKYKCIREKERDLTQSQNLHKIVC